ARSFHRNRRLHCVWMNGCQWVVSKFQANLVSVPMQNLVDNDIETGAWRTLIISVFDQSQRRVGVAPVMSSVSVHRGHCCNNRLDCRVHKAVTCVKSRSEGGKNDENRFDHVGHRFSPSWIL